MGLENLETIRKIRSPELLAQQVSTFTGISVKALVQYPEIATAIKIMTVVDVFLLVFLVIRSNAKGLVMFGGPRFLSRFIKSIQTS